MKTISLRFLIINFLLLTAHQLPAPIVEETPQPRAAPKRKPETETSAKTKKPSNAESGMSSRSVQVILTENTRAALTYLRNYVQTYESMPLTGKSDVRPDEIMEQLRQALSTRFSNVSILNGSGSSKGGLSMIFDLQAHVGSSSFTSNNVSFIATFKDGGRTIQSISASGTSSIPYPAFATQFPKAVSRAFADFSQKLNAAR